MADAQGNHNSYVYVLGCTESTLVKIGVSNDVPRRVSEIERVSPISIKVLWQTPGSFSLEAALHRALGEYRRQGEWFDFGGQDAVAVVADAVTTLVKADPAYADDSVDRLAGWKKVAEKNWPDHAGYMTAADVCETCGCHLAHHSKATNERRCRGDKVYAQACTCLGYTGTWPVIVGSIQTDLGFGDLPVYMREGAVSIGPGMPLPPRYRETLVDAS